ncbi:hypothetical protein MPSEU_000232000 [Mayamaea pseudoterrestris]|nr:hypothetical protein MPSEU_000232000 [Mayamaea pseudoterrestris]
MVSTTTPRWGDDMDDSDDEEMRGSALNNENKQQVVVPPTHKSRIDSQGIQITTTYKRHPTHSHQLIKTITKSKIEIVKCKEPKSMQERRQWKVFGQAAVDLKEKNQTTVQSKEEILLEDPHADTDLQDQDAGAAIAGNLNAFWAKQQRRQLERKYDVGGTPGATEGGAEGWTQVGKTLASGGAFTPGAAAAGTGPGKYMTPAQRAGLVNPDASGGDAGAFRRTDDLNTLRVTNLSTSTTESDIQELFARYGRISRVYLAKDKETLESRGFAFVSFVNKEDAARAMEGLQGHGYDHLILKIEFARPNAKDPSAATEFRSGYGKALAQDTTAKVSYASNLTR